MSLSSETNSSIAKLKDRLERVHRAAMFRVAVQTDIKSPVRDGYFRANWIGAYGSVDRTTFDSPARDAVGEVQLYLARNAMAENVFYYTNSLPYAFKIEYESHSAQAPNGVVRLTARNFDKYVTDAIRSIK